MSAFVTHKIRTPCLQNMHYALLNDVSGKFPEPCELRSSVALWLRAATLAIKQLERRIDVAQ